MTYRINTPSVIYEILDGEAVILNLDEGIYYSLNESGKEIWNSLSAGASFEKAVSLFEPGGNDQTIRNELAKFIDELIKEKLIVPYEAAHKSEQKTYRKMQFETPVLHIYHDMKELLLLDPIHEVDQAGWPVAPR